MSSDPDKTTVSSSTIQDIIKRLSELGELTAKSAGITETENPQDGSTGGDGDDGKETPKTESGNKGEDANNDGGFSKTEAQHELGKLYKELDYMLRSFKKLEEFQKDLSDPLKTLEDNVNDIVTDLNKKELPKQVQHNLRVLRNNIIRVKILIPPQRQAASLNSEGNRGLQTTVATGDTGDLPHLYGEDLFEQSYYFKEIEEKYESFNDDKRLKLCLLCFAIFPENAEIKKRFLRYWWVGENLVPPQEGKDEKEIVNETLNVYVEKGLIQPVLKKNRLEPRSYKMDPIVRSCLIRFAEKNRFFDINTEGKPTMNFSTCYKACMVRSDGAPVPWFSDYLKGKAAEQQGQGKTGEQQGPEKLPADLVKLQMLFNFPDKDTLKKASQEFDKLQTLFNLSKQFPGLPKEWFSKMSSLKVLYMGKWETTAGGPRHIEVEDIDFLKALKKMKNLRLLSLQGVSGIPKIPGTLGSLENLKILDLRACHNLESLPDKIGSLKALTYLDLSECYLLDYMPKRLSELKELQVLKGFVIVDTKNSCTLNDLSKLENLKKLSINVNTTKFNLNDEEKSLTRFKKLEKLRIAWGSRGMPPPSGTENQEASGTGTGTAIASNEKENNGEYRGNEANSKSTKAEDGKKQSGGGVSEQESKRGGLKEALSRPRVLAAMVLGRAREQENLTGLENLVKLDLQCFPYAAPPEWLVPSKLRRLRNLSIRGGKLSYLKHEEGQKWKVDTLRLKFLVDFKMNWKEMRERFPRLKYLENVRSPRITLCPCDENGIWQA
ncbi:hypothetical protein HRI_004269100 [Hibiscus trionum]|uniref:Uncharacterized protein n=1 Tax=Hibiscus trionum TaxID=183268 RepID=A0A9W7J636_HIBTR|nr:hypothetical protein HRI_004269100 [Hibiscus trionum]